MNAAIISVALHYYCFPINYRYVNDYGNVADKPSEWSQTISEAHDYLIRAELILVKGGKFFANREPLNLFIKRVLETPLPVKGWVNV